MHWASADHWRGRRVLVTGASGFIGAVVARTLAAAEAEVHGSGATRNPPPEINGHRAFLPADASSLVQAVEPEVVFHLAAPVHLGSDPSVEDALRSGIVDASRSIAEACAVAGARLVHIGTCAEYGLIEAPYSESDACDPRAPYARLKLEATQAVLQRSSTQSVTVVRPFRAIGPGDNNSVVAAACRAALSAEAFEMTDGEQIREWNNVNAVARGIVCAGAHPDAIGQTLNVGGGERCSVIEIVRTIFGLAGAANHLIHAGVLKRRPNEVDHFWGDHSASETMWGPIAQPPLQDTLASCLQWRRAQSGGAA